MKKGTLVAPTNIGFDVKTGRDLDYTKMRGTVISEPFEALPGTMFVVVKWIGRSAWQWGPKSQYEVSKLRTV